ncbi:hypothetical protein GCM10007205_18480 [Oxalicibacterium flavum]|uniref:Response regulatory domain-containing protein n=1 Tax=Oxalicibacterium flavum TaxID=179467 RepID=A0A8J2XXE5_9BURK|nr:response regulator [Oxalicibacterium flavum]GGC09650.1 hypothetical protein GCM10007205_18480 [Oxalicibacterium flavum]
MQILATPFPFAVRLLGFSPQETEVFDATFAIRQNGCGYLKLDDDNLQDPDLYIVNADNIKALVALDQLRPSDLRPALLVGDPLVPLPYARIERPLRWHRLYDELKRLIERRADALSRLEASDVVAVSERRRGNRVDIDLTDPADYARRRTEPMHGGAVLVIDSASAFGDVAAETLARLQTRVIRAASEAEVEAACARQRIAVTIINTAMEIDPYRLCQTVRKVWPSDRMAVIFLATRAGSFDVARAREAGYDGFLTMPVSASNLISALRRFMTLPR